MKLLYELSFEHLKVEMPEGDLVIIVSKCSKMKLFATGDSEFHIVGVFKQKLEKQWIGCWTCWLNGSSPMCAFKILCFMLYGLSSYIDYENIDN